MVELRLMVQHEITQNEPPLGWLARIGMSVLTLLTDLPGIYGREPGWPHERPDALPKLSQSYDIHDSAPHDRLP